MATVSGINDLVHFYKDTRKARLRYNFGDINYNSDNDVYASAKGRMYDGWIDLSGRSNSYSEGDLIENPIGVIESVIRDMVLTEHNLEVSEEYYPTGEITFNGNIGSLLHSIDNYYTGAYLHNVTKNWTKEITGYVGSSKTLYVASLGANDIYVGDKCYITNIKGNDLIDYASFDTAMAQYSSQKFGFSLDEQIDAHNLLNDLCFEAQCTLYKNFNKYYIKKLGTGTVDGTLSNPLKDKNKLIEYSFTNIEDIATDFIINYCFLSQENSYVKTIYCNKNGTSHTSALSSYVTLCKNAETNYKLSRKYEIDLNFIYDEATALEFAKRIIKENTFQKMVIGYIGSVNEHIQYQKGDLVKVNVPDIIPSIKNNVTQFLITKQDIPYKSGSTEVIFNLIEMVE